MYNVCNLLNLIEIICHVIDVRKMQAKYEANVKNNVLHYIKVV